MNDYNTNPLPPDHKCVWIPHHNELTGKLVCYVCYCGMHKDAIGIGPEPQGEKQ